MRCAGRCHNERVRALTNVLAVIGALAIVVTLGVIIWFWSVSSPADSTPPPADSAGTAESAPAEGGAQQFTDVTVQATMPFSEVEQQVGRGITYADAGGGQVQATVPVEILGRTFTAESVASVSTDGRNIIVTPETVDVPGPAIADAAAGQIVRRLVTISEPVPDLPQTMQLRDITTVPGGFRVTLDAPSLALPADAGGQ